MTRTSLSIKLPQFPDTRRLSSPIPESPSEPALSGLPQILLHNIIIILVWLSLLST